MRTATRSARFISSLVLGVLCSATAPADPPDHAPAHGWRRQHDDDRDHDRRHGHDYVGYEGRHWDNDYEVLSGRCDRHAVATAIGGVVGGVVGNRVASPENRTIATLIGAAAGALIGNRVGRALDDADRGCFGHALELGRPGRLVAWTNDDIGVRYEMLPGDRRDRRGAVCRAFVLTTITGREKTSRSGVACRTQVGGWQIEG
jgi:surface antigen